MFKGHEREPPFVMLIDPKAKLMAALNQAETYLGLAIKAEDRGERECYEQMAELYLKIAEHLEALIEG